MKLKNGVAFLLIAALLFSCGKDGEVGPQGPKGEQGQAGIDGTKVLSGTDNPSTITGKEGDFYINLTTKILFGPKLSSGWGNGVGLSGTDGKDGNTILNGKGAPAPSLGNLGDFYFDTENLTIYGAKLSSGWGTPTSLRPNTDSGIKIIIKEGIKLVFNDSEIEHYSEEGLNRFSINDIENKVMVGDINKYLNEGAVLYQVKVNNQLWMYTFSEHETSSFFFYSGIERFSSYDGNYLFFKDNDCSMKNIPGTKAQAINIFKNEVSKNTTSYKIILISPNTLQKLSRTYPGKKIDNNFLLNYYKTI